MPIRFRCVYCDQLLGIARRKAGTVVKCPNCAGQLIVPAPEQVEKADDSSDPDSPTAAAEDAVVREHATVQEKTAPAPPVEAAAGGMLFERSDFDELLKPALERKEPALAGKSARTARKAPAPAPLQGPANAFDFEATAPAQPAPAPAPVPVVAPVAAEKRRTGILLTPIKLILLFFFVMAGMGFAFGGGLLLGLYLRK